MLKPRTSLWALLLLLPAAAPTGLAAQECRESEPVRRPVVNGVVVDSVTRVPLAAAEVRVAWSEPDGRERYHAMKTDSAGRFRLCRLPVGPLLTLRAEFSDSGERQQFRLAAADSLELQLAATAVHSELRGRVFRADDRGPVSTADVRVLDTPLSAVTDADGEFSFPQIPPGRYRVQIALLGYGERTDTVAVEQRTTVRLEAALAPAAVKLPPLGVDARSQLLESQGFYERRERGHGAFLTRAQWQNRLPVRTSDVLRGVPGVRVVPVRAGLGSVVLDRRGCPVRYVMDNVRLDPTFQLDQVNAAWIEALEIYRGPSEVPPQFMSPMHQENAHCGVIVIWTTRQ